MELSEFVKETLLQLIDGVRNAQSASEDTDAVINPRTLFNAEKLPTVTVRGERRLVQLVEFEVGLTSADLQSSKKGIGVMLGGLGVGGDAERSGTRSTVTHIRFNIPIVLPGVDVGNTPHTPTPRTNPNKHRY